MVTAIKEQQVDVDKQSIRVWFGDNVAEDIWKCRFTYGLMANMEKTERGISIMVFIRWTAQEIWEMEEAALEKHRINYIIPKILKSFREKKSPTSNVIRHSKSSTANLFLVPEDICAGGAYAMKLAGFDD